MTQTIETLTADVLIATDEGTHGMPDTMSAYERLDGSRYTKRYHGGTLLGTEEGVGASEHGRVRFLRHTPAAQRRRLIEEIREAEAKEAKAQQDREYAEAITRAHHRPLTEGF
jgi:hypothetical protein